MGAGPSTASWDLPRPSTTAFHEPKVIQDILAEFPEVLPDQLPTRHLHESYFQLSASAWLSTPQFRPLYRSSPGELA
jgi:hypothetical protein